VADVARAEHVAVEAPGRLVRIVPVAGGDLRPAQADLPVGARRQQPAGVVPDRDLDVGERPAGRADLLELAARVHEGVARAGLGQPEAVDVPGIPEQRREGPDAILRGLLAAADAPLEGREVEAVARLAGQQPADHDGREPRARQPLRFDGG
jgi:hypothetical protein